jgi:hypothetical protein
MHSGQIPRHTAVGIGGEIAHEIETQNLTGPRPKGGEEEEDKFTFYNEHANYALFFVM